MIVVLWTDALVWVLVALVVAYVLYARRKAHLAAPWRRVGRSAAVLADERGRRCRQRGGPPTRRAGRFIAFLRPMCCRLRRTRGRQ